MREDWIETRLDDIFDIVTGNTPPKKIAGNYGNVIPFIKPPEINNNTITTATDSLSEMGKKNARILPINSVLVTCIGNLGRVAINKYEVAFNQQINALKPVNNISSRYTFYQAQSVSFRNSLEKLSTSTTVALVNKSNFSTINYKLAPLPIQRAIVSKIENLFSDLDNGIANLTKAQAQLKIYRQAVLKKAFEGELTKEWREQQNNLPTAEELLKQIKEERQKHYDQQIEEWKEAVKEWENKGKEGKKQTKPKAIKELPPLTEDNLKKLPEGWNWCPFSNIGFWTGGGTPSKAEPIFWKNGDILWITSKDMKSKVIFDSIDKITSNAVKKSSAKIIDKGSILFVMRSGILRRILPIALTSTSATVNQDLQALTPYLVNSQYIYWYSVSNEYDIRKNCAKDGTTVESVESTLLKKYPFSLCSLQEQNQIVQEIKSRLSVCDKVEQNISESLEKTKALRQSILKKAFEGKLLSKAEIEACKQEKDYELASVLLQKIKAEKIKTQSLTSKNKTKKKAKK